MNAAVRRPQSRDGLRISVCCAGIGWAERTASKRGPHQLTPFETVLRREPDRHLQRAAARGRGDERQRADDSGERGVCVNTASIAAYDGQIGQIAYSASKGGIVGLTLPAARDLAAADPRRDDRAGHRSTLRCWRGLPEESRDALGEAVPFPHASGDPAEFAALAVHIVANPMLNGEDPARRRTADAAALDRRTGRRAPARAPGRRTRTPRRRRPQRPREDRHVSRSASRAHAPRRRTCAARPA